MNDKTRIEEKLREFRPMPGFACPAEFWPALGYGGSARYVGIWWEQCGDEASYSDGMQSFVGADWPAYLALMDHNFAEGDAAHWLLGASDSPATEKLVIDRETERAWLVPVDEAAEVLRLQFPVVDAAEDGIGAISFENVMRAIERMMTQMPPALSVAEIEAMMDESSGRLAALEAALEARKRGAGRCAVCGGTGWMEYPHPDNEGGFTATAEGPCAGCIQDGLCARCGRELVACGPMLICAGCGFMFDEAAHRQMARLQEPE